MGYKLSFSKKDGIIIVGCLLVAGILIFCGGLLLGLRHSGEIITAPNLARKTSAPKDVYLVPQLASSKLSTDDNLHITSVAKRYSNLTNQNPRSYCLQFGSFYEKDHADRLAKILKGQKVSVQVVRFKVRNKIWYVVRAGRYSSVDEAATQAAKFKKDINISSLVRRTGTI